MSKLNRLMSKVTAFGTAGTKRKRTKRAQKSAWPQGSALRSAPPARATGYLSKLKDKRRTGRSA